MPHSDSHTTPLHPPASHGVWPTPASSTARWRGKLGLVAGAVLALSACSGGGGDASSDFFSGDSGNDGVSTDTGDVMSAAEEATAGGPLGDVQSGLNDALRDGVVANIPDPTLMQFAASLTDATLYSTDVTDELLATLIAAGDMAQAGDSDPAAYQQLLTDAGEEMLADLQAAADTIASAAMALGGPTGGPDVPGLSALTDSATALQDALSDPTSLDSPEDVIAPLQGLIDDLMALNPADLPGAGDGLPGQDDLNADALQAVIDPLTDGLTSAQGTLEGLFAQAGLGDAIGDGSSDLTAPITGLADALGADAGPLADLFAMFTGQGSPVPADALAGLGQLQDALDALMATDNPLAPLLSAEAGEAALASLFGDLTNILPDAACALIPVAPGCSDG